MDKESTTHTTPLLIAHVAPCRSVSACTDRATSKLSEPILCPKSYVSMTMTHLLGGACLRNDAPTTVATAATANEHTGTQ